MNIVLHTMLRATPSGAEIDLDTVSDALHALALCQQVCHACADACLVEQTSDALRACVRVNLDCAVVCHAAAALLLRREMASARALDAQLQACVVMCQVCADACAAHAAEHNHCAICADTCRLRGEHCQMAIDELRETAAPRGGSAKFQDPSSMETPSSRQRVVA